MPVFPRQLTASMFLRPREFDECANGSGPHTCDMRVAPTAEDDNFAARVRPGRCETVTPCAIEFSHTVLNAFTSC